MRCKLAGRNRMRLAFSIVPTSHPVRKIQCENSPNLYISYNDRPRAGDKWEKGNTTVKA